MNMPKYLFHIAVCFLVLLSLLVSCVSSGDSKIKHDSETLRIISLAPSITETVFLLGLGVNLVGVSKFCDYPPEAISIAKVGGLVDPNLEVIARLKPDIVILFHEHDEVKKYLDRLSIEYLEVDHRRVSGILDSFEAIGRRCSVEQRADKVVDSLNAVVDSIRSSIKGKTAGKVLITFGRSFSGDKVEDTIAAGRGTYYDDLLRISGIENAYPNADIAYPRVSAEGLLGMNPSVIIELVEDLQSRHLKKDELLSDWAEMKGLSALENDRIYVLGGDYVVVPGPRFIELVKDINNCVYGDKVK